MKNKYFIFLFLFSWILSNSVFAQQQEVRMNNLLDIGITTLFLTDDGKQNYTFGPLIQFKLADRWFIAAQYYGYKENALENNLNVRDGIPRVSYTENYYRHLPLALKYNIAERDKITYYFKLIGTYQFQHQITNTYKLNTINQKDEHDYHSVLYGTSVGVDFLFCYNSLMEVEAFFKTSKSFKRNIVGLEISCPFKLKLKKHEK